MRTSLTTRMVLLTTGVACLVAAVAAVAAWPMLRSAADSQGRADLARLADLTAVALAQTTTSAQVPDELLSELRDGRVSAFLFTSPSATIPGLSGDQPATVLGAAPGFALATTSPDGEALVEARTLASGLGLVLLQPNGVADALAWQQETRLIAALSLGLLAAGLFGLLAARRLARPLQSLRGAAVRLAAGDRDVALEPNGPTEVIEVAEAINRLSDALAASEGRQRSFLLSISHELRTPLTAVIGHAEALREGVLSGSEVAAAAAVIERESVRLGRLVDDLLVLARLEAVDFPLQRTTVDLMRLAQETAGARREGGVSVDVRATALPGTFDQDVPEVLVDTDPMRARQLLDNLLDNAIRVSPPGGTVLIHVERLNSWGLMSVTDQGPGLSEDDIAVAFQVGTLHHRYGAARAGTSGLGLALVQRLITRLGGEVRVSSSPGSGVRFDLLFPAA
ncbi:MAG: ATP-binding protein [Actinomycetales bacterium]